MAIGMHIQSWSHSSNERQPMAAIQAAAWVAWKTLQFGLCCSCKIPCMTNCFWNWRVSKAFHDGACFPMLSLHWLKFRLAHLHSQANSNKIGSLFLSSPLNHGWITPFLSPLFFCQEEKGIWRVVCRRESCLCNGWMGVRFLNTFFSSLA